MSFVQRWLLSGVLWITRRPRTTLLIILLLVAGAATLAITRLTISSDQNKLFSPNVPFFRDYLHFIHEFPENEAVYIVIEPRDPAIHPMLDQWTACADTITARLQAMPDDVKSAYCRIPLDQLGRQGLLFEDQSELPRRVAQIEQLAPLARIFGEAPTGAEQLLLSGPPIQRFLTGAGFATSDQAAEFDAAMVNSWDQAVQNPNSPLKVGQGVLDLNRLTATDPKQLGYTYVRNEEHPSQHRILVSVYPTRKFNSLTSVTETINAIRAAAKDAGKPFPEFKIGVTGRPALEADQMATTDEDSHKAEALALVTVFIGMSLMLRSIWLAAAAEIALGVGIGWTFGYATISVGELNLLSLVFLIALIGIGMDYLVQILMRYRQEARRYARPSAVWIRVFRYVGPPINTACLGAAGAFLVSVFTDFRGAAELGIIAGGGLILCLIAGYTVLPALLTLFPKRLPPYPVSSRYRKPRPISAARLLLPAIWALALLLGSPFMTRTQFDPGLINLQVPGLESVKLIRTLQTWVGVVLTKNPAQLVPLTKAVAPLPEVKSVESIADAEANLRWLQAHGSEIPNIKWTPPPPVTAADLPNLAAQADILAGQFHPQPAHPAQADAIAALHGFSADLRALKGNAATDAAQRLTIWQNIFFHELHEMIEQFHPAPLNLAALPAQLRDHFVSPDGYYALYIHPARDLWDGQQLAHFVTSVEKAVATVPDAPPVTGIASNVYHTTEAIHSAFYHATIYALVLIFILVLLDMRNLWTTLAAISVLALGLPMLVAIMGLIGENWNFANFFGLPILIGAGHEYGVFMVHRYLEACAHPRRVWGRWDPSDRALLLCAFITSSSFGFFWLLAQHQGLRSLGLVMAVGTACIYLSTIMALRPILKWRLQKCYPSPEGAQPVA